MILDPVQARVLGTLIEKEIVTPENYPLSLNALIAGCNQKSSRDPVMELSEDEVRQALHVLEQKGLTSVNRDARVPKFEHRARTVLNLRRDETAILCLLLLRGPQTPGELRSRADRMYAFDDIPAVESTLTRLASAPSGDDAQSQAIRPLVAALARQPGSRELRYAHLLSGPLGEAVRPNRIAQQPPPWEPEDASSEPLLTQRVKELEAQMEALRSMMNRLEDRLRSEALHADPSDTETSG
ncbi:MAG TPA: YceH family protein [Acidobacteriaceae bacterium]|nr:YceH family protein [Acidobacteriaceae bacterium]